MFMRGSLIFGCQSDHSFAAKLPYLRPTHSDVFGVLTVREAVPTMRGAHDRCIVDLRLAHRRCLKTGTLTHVIQDRRDGEQNVTGEKGLMQQRRMRGFSLIEMMAVLGIIIIVSSMSIITLQPVLKSTRVANAYNLTLSAMRQAHDLAVAQRQTIYINFNNTPVPNVITITNGGDGTVLYTYTLPADVSFVTVAGIPTGAGQPPDGFGNGSNAIDFDQGVGGGDKTTIYFYPDGSAKDINGYTNNGVIYVARSSELYSSRAITLWGLTGRLRGWRLFQTTSSNYWREE